jgi:FAD/FMN-containing dehydrogenase
MSEIRQLGGALGRPHPNGGAVSQFRGQFLVFAGGMAMTPAMAMAAEADAMALTGSLTEWASGSAYLNFAENEMDASTAFPSRTWERLQAIRSTVDPDGIFVANHEIPRA